MWKHRENNQTIDKTIHTNVFYDILHQILLREKYEESGMNTFYLNEILSNHSF